MYFKCDGLYIVHVFSPIKLIFQWKQRRARSWTYAFGFFFGSRNIPLLYFHFWLVLQQNARTGIMNYESLLISAAYGKSVRTGKLSGHIETWTRLDSMQRMQLFMLTSIYIVCTLYALCTVNGPLQMQDACSTLIHIQWNMCMGPDARCVCMCDCSQTHTCLLRLCFLAPLPLLC